MDKNNYEVIKQKLNLEDFLPTWDDVLDLGIEDIDEEHRLFMRMMDKVFKSVESGFSEYQLALSEVIKHLVWHFKNEEDYMRCHGISEEYISLHISIHYNFITQLNTIETSVVRINDSDELYYDKDLAYSIAFFIKNWLVFHIISEDINIAKQINLMKEHNVSKEDAFILVKETQDDKLKIFRITISNLLKIFELRNNKLAQIEKEVRHKLIDTEKRLLDNIEENKLKSITDELTGLKNRRYAMESLRKIWTTFLEPVCSVIQLDLDNFKEINDTYGHHAGDVVLTEFANTVVNFINNNVLYHKDENYKNNIHFCRLGGDEFLMILLDFSLVETVEIANELLKEINKIEVYYNKPNPIWYGKASMGVANRNLEHRDYESVLKEADRLLYIAKEDGRNCVRPLISETYKIGGGYD